ncbi:MAG: rhamnan synthesis F family protein [Pseudomonadota bacterium]
MTALEPDLAERLRSLFDAPYYRAQHGALAPEADALQDFLSEGWKQGLSPHRRFDPLAYIAENTQSVGAENPFLHFLRSGAAFGETSEPHFRDPDPVALTLPRHAATEYGPIRHVLRYEASVPRLPGSIGPIAVHLHLYFTDDLVEMCSSLANIPARFTLLVSVPETANIKRISTTLKQLLPRAREIIVRAVTNRGRDVAPWLTTFQDEIKRSAFFLHIHTKRSDHSGLHTHWRRFLLHTLLGNESVAAQVLWLFLKDPHLGVISPGYWAELRRLPLYSESFDAYAALVQRLGISADKDTCPDFPAGSMFWARTSAIAPLLDLNLSVEDFADEAGQITGTLAHAVERIIGESAQINGLRLGFCAVDTPHELAAHRYTPVPVGNLPKRAHRLSVILRAGGSTDQIEASLSALFNQTQPPRRVVVMVNDSTLPLCDPLIDRFTPQFERGQIKLVAGLGFHEATTLAAALGEVAGKGAAFLDAGETPHETWLETFGKALAGGAGLSLQSEKCDATWAENLEGGAVRPSQFAIALDAIKAPDLSRLPPRSALEAYLRSVARSQKLRWVPGSVPKAAALKAPNLSGFLRLERIAQGREPHRIAIKNPAHSTEGPNSWGDTHFANSLAKELKKFGHIVRIDLRDDWYSDAQEHDTVSIALRGVVRYQPAPHQINLMWHISHPKRVSIEEMAQFDHVFVASYPYATKLWPKLKTRVSALLQCADPALAQTRKVATEAFKDRTLFIGNSRKQSRWMPSACLNAGLSVDVYGREWEGLLPDAVVKGSYVPNADLGEIYRAATLVLNDHWPDMAEHGFISNRIMDVGMAGGCVVSDSFASEEIFFGAVTTVRDEASLQREVERLLTQPALRTQRATALSALVRRHHSFAHRARVIDARIRRLTTTRID